MIIDVLLSDSTLPLVFRGYKIPYPLNQHSDVDRQIPFETRILTYFHLQSAIITLNVNKTVYLINYQSKIDIFLSSKL